MHPVRRGAFAPILSPAFHHVSRCFFQKDAKAGEDEEAYVARLIQEYEDMFQRLGPGTVAAVIFEPVSGATLGSVPAANGYLAAVREVCDKYGALLIFDEVMCGMGRCGTLHAWQSLGSVVPDLQSIGKGLGGGYQPISAVLVGPKVFNIIETPRTPSVFLSGHTYQDHPIGCAAALATQEVIIREKLLDQVKARGEFLSRKLQKSTPLLKEVRGLGLFRTVEFDTPADCAIAPEVASTCLKNGAAVYLCSDATDAVMFAPPYIISEAEIDDLVDIFAKSVRSVLSSRGLEEPRPKVSDQVEDIAPQVAHL